MKTYVRLSDFLRIWLLLFSAIVFSHVDTLLPQYLRG